MGDLDTIDLKILAILQEDASRSIASIAESVHLSQNACWRRIQNLEASGVIRKRVALLDAKKLGVGTTAFVMIRTSEHSDKWLDGFAAGVERIPEVMEFYRMTGDVDYLIKLQIADISAYDEVYKSLIRTARLTGVSGSFAMEQLKHTTSLPLPKAAGR